MMNWGNYGWGMGFGWVWMILFWALAIAGIAYIVQAVTRGFRKADQVETPLDILKKRYARGEISKDEFERMRDNLSKK